MNAATRTYAEIEIVHRDALGNVKSVEHSKREVVVDAEGKIVEVK